MGVGEVPPIIPEPVETDTGGGGDDGVGGGGSSVASAGSVVLYGPVQIGGRRGVYALVAADGACALAVQITHDQGATWTTARLVAAALAGTGGDATYTYVVKLDELLPSFVRIVLVNNKGSALAYRYDLRTYEIAGLA